MNLNVRRLLLRPQIFLNMDWYRPSRSKFRNLYTSLLMMRHPKYLKVAFLFANGQGNFSFISPSINIGSQKDIQQQIKILLRIGYSSIISEMGASN